MRDAAAAAGGRRAGAGRGEALKVADGMSRGPGEAGSGGVPARQTPRAIDREQFERVIRRAAELSLRDADAHEQLSEAEVLRIAQELGLAGHHVQRALFELPELTVQPRWYDRYFGTPLFSVGRVVPSDTNLTLRRLEDYLVTREYLQVVRRRGENIALIPADDTISSLARTFFRSGARHHIAKATRVLVSAQPLEDGSTHVRVDVDLSDDRRSSANTALWLGASAGIGVGAVAGHFTDLALGSAALLGAVPGIIAFCGGFAGTFAAIYARHVKRFRDRLHAARLEITSLLDRLEQGTALDPPPAPWRRRLGDQLFGPHGER